MTFLREAGVSHWCITCSTCSSGWNKGLEQLEQGIEGISDWLYYYYFIYLFSLFQCSNVPVIFKQIPPEQFCARHVLHSAPRRNDSATPSLLFFCWNIGTLEQDPAKSLIALLKACSSKTRFLEHFAMLVPARFLISASRYPERLFSVLGYPIPNQILLGCILYQTKKWCVTHCASARTEI